MAPPSYIGSYINRYTADPYDVTVSGSADFVSFLLRNDSAGGVLDSLTATLEGAAMTLRQSSNSGSHVCHAFDRASPSTGANITFDWSTPTNVPSWWQVSGAQLSGVTGVRNSTIVYESASQDYIEGTVTSDPDDLILGLFIGQSMSQTLSARSGSTVQDQSQWDSVCFGIFTKSGASGSVTAGINFSSAHAERRFLMLYSLQGSGGGGGGSPFLKVLIKPRV